MGDLLELILELILFGFYKLDPKNKDNSKDFNPTKILLGIILALIYLISIYILIWYAIFAVEKGIPKRIVAGILGIYLLIFSIRYVYNYFNKK